MTFPFGKRSIRRIAAVLGEQDAAHERRVALGQRGPLRRRW
jgi:hypothetical protein